MTHMRPTTTGLMLVLMLALTLLGHDRAMAATQIQDITRIKGSEENKLIGMGLVVGLNGTGDGGKFMPAMRPLAAVIQQLIDPNTVAEELKDAKNVALVSLTANLPATGVREGDRVDVNVAAVGAARSLNGGRLFMVPLTGPMPNAPVFAFAEGAVIIEGDGPPTVGVVRNGAQLTRDVMTRYIDQFGRITLVIDNNLASWPIAKNLAALINEEIAPDGPNLARALDQKNIVIQVPRFEQQDPAGFISQILEIAVASTSIRTEARVLINEKTETIVIDGNVMISPVLISHRGLTITTITPEPEPTEANPRVDQQNWVKVDPENTGGRRLDDLVAAFNQLKVPARDRIAIIKEIHRSGKLHARLIIEGN